MTLNPIKSPLVFSASFCCLTFVVAYFLPVWDTSTFYGFGLLGNGMDVYSDYWVSRKYGATSHFLAAQKGNIVKLLVVASVGAISGRLMHWLIWGRRCVK